MADYGPRSKANARLLLATASALGYPSSIVKTSRVGYSVPQDVLDAVLGVDKIKEGVFYPAPTDTSVEGRADGPMPVERPRGNASREAWADYANALGLYVNDDLSRDDIKNLVNEEE